MEDAARGGADQDPLVLPLAEALSAWLEADRRQLHAELRHWVGRARRAEATLAQVQAERDELERRWDHLMAGYPTRRNHEGPGPGQD